MHTSSYIGLHGNFLGYIHRVIGDDSTSNCLYLPISDNRTTVFICNRQWYVLNFCSSRL